jgi:hypothetical protein
VPTRDAVPETYRVHPLLDPILPSRQPAQARFWLSTYQRLARDPESYRQVLSSFIRPPGGQQATARTLETYLRDADLYLDDLLRLIPPEEADRLKPQARCRETNGLLELLREMFEGPDSRIRYEAQRKLQLSRMLFDVDHCRTVRDGPRHRDRFERLLERNLWSEAEAGVEVLVCCELREDRTGLERLEIGVPRSPRAQCIRFQVRTLPARTGEPEIQVYHYHSRFKRERTRVAPVPAADGTYRLVEAERWPGLGRRSGSILSKMIRQGIGDPHFVKDILGAMFIVGNARQAHRLERRLLDPLGGPFRWRDRVDTLAGEQDRDRLNAHSAGGFKVLKKIVDILTEDPTAPSPYLYSVEIQIFPVEEYLRTLFDATYVGHDAYKRRQFLHDILPLLFPAEVFGPHEGLLERVTGTTGIATGFRQNESNL